MGKGEVGRGTGHSIHVFTAAVGKKHSADLNVRVKLDVSASSGLVAGKFLRHEFFIHALISFHSYFVP